MLYGLLTSHALYACKFAELLHNLGTPYFSTLQFFDKVHL